MDAVTKIRVCFVAPKAYPLFNPDAKNVKDPFGGSEVDLYLLALELAKDEKFEISFITADYGQEEVETFQRVKVIKSLNFEEGSLRGAFRVWRAMKKTDANIFMLKTASYGVPLVAIFCLLHRRIFAYRTASQNECDGNYVRAHPVLGPVFKFSLRTAKLVFTQNVTDRENLLQSTGISSIFIRNGHYIDELTEGDRDIILWVARSSREKRPDLFLDLAGRLPDEKFVMICPRALGDEKYEQLEVAARTVKNLTFIRSVPFHQTHAFFRRAKIFVCTSHREGFPNTYIQACINAVPIVSLNTNPDGFLDEYDCGLCSDNDFDKLVDLLKTALEKNRYEQMGKNARKYAEQNHDVKRIAQEYKELFRRLV